jgi:hypothetical protein
MESTRRGSHPGIEVTSTMSNTMTRRGRAEYRKVIREEAAFLRDCCGYRDQRIAARLGISTHTLARALGAGDADDRNGTDRAA